MTGGAAELLVVDDEEANRDMLSRRLQLHGYRVTTAEGVLETIYDLAGIAPPAETENVFRGHPLAAPPKGAGLVFYGIWPGVVVAAALLTRRRR